MLSIYFLLPLFFLSDIGAGTLIDNIKSLYGQRNINVHFHSKHPLIGTDSTIFSGNTNGKSITILAFTNYSRGTMLSHQLSVSKSDKSL